MKKIYLITIIAMSVFMFSCSKSETKTLKSNTISLLEEYPYEGANTLTGNWKIDFGTIDVTKIKSARVKSVTLEMVNPKTSKELEEITVLLAASGASMQKIGVLNPVPNDETLLTPVIAENQKEIAELLKQGEITLVTDINIKEDMENELSINAVLEFDIEVKQ